MSRAVTAYNRAIELKPDFAEALFGKARSLCFLAGKNMERFPAKECYREAIELLERAVAIAPWVIGRIARDRFAFLRLRRDPDYGPRFHALLLSPETDQGTSPTPS